MWKHEKCKKRIKHQNYTFYHWLSPSLSLAITIALRTLSSYSTVYMYVSLHYTYTLRPYYGILCGVDFAHAVVYIDWRWDRPRYVYSQKSLVTWSFRSAHYLYAFSASLAAYRLGDVHCRDLLTSLIDARLCIRGWNFKGEASLNPALGNLSPSNYRLQITP